VVSTLDRHQNVVDAVAFDPDNRRVWTVAVQDAIRAWDAGTGRVVRTVSLNGLDGMYTAFELRPGRRVLYLRARGQIQERNLGD
jgi:WD40 repeat protein